VPFLKELALSNITRGANKGLIVRILEAILSQGVSLEKLKLSNVNLNDHKIVSLICQIIKTMDFVTELDLSWAKLNPK
jgi:hypothetical protein